MLSCRAVAASSKAGDVFGDVLGERGDLRRIGGKRRVLSQKIAVVLDHGAAAGRGHQDGVEPLAGRFLAPRRDIGASPRQCVLVVAEVMGQRAAALLVPDQDDLDAVAGEETDGGLVDARRQHLLGTALEQRDPAALLAECREHTAGERAPAAAAGSAPAPASP